MSRPYTVGERLKSIMERHGMRQVDLINKVNLLCERKGYDVHIGKSDLSQYLSGKTEPGEDKLFVIAEALSVNEAWLAGFNAPMNPPSTPGMIDMGTADINLMADERYLVEQYRILNTGGKNKVISYTEDLVALGKYTGKE